MKKTIVGLVLAAAAFAAKADYLYWGVTSSEASGTSYNAARLWQRTDNTISTDGATAVGWLYDIPGAKSTSVTIDSSAQAGTYYFVELCNYSNSTWSSGATSSSTYTYSSLVEKGVITSSDLIAQASVASQVLTYHGVQATPEPTSGLLMLMGFAMLGLKRKKEV